jgi:hypothetical protein
MEAIMPRRRGGLRGRLDRLESNAHQTMNTAQGAILSVRDVVEGLLEDLQDGVDIHIVRKGDASIMDFLSGKVEELPFALRIVPEEETPTP